MAIVSYTKFFSDDALHYHYIVLQPRLIQLSILPPLNQSRITRSRVPKNENGKVCEN